MLSTEIYCTNADAIEALMQEFAADTLKSHKIRRLGLAISGGADSLALFHLLVPICRKINISPVVLHLNHGLRAESKQESLFVEELAKSNHLSFFTKSLDLKNRESSKQSLEMAAREARLQFYGECTADGELDAIATGHHANDVCETLLLRLTRGAGIAGLAGMRPLSFVMSGGSENLRVTLVRPLLNITSSALQEWLRARNLKWCDDLSNLDTSIPRNNIRHKVIPWLRENLWADIESRLCQSAMTMREDEAFLNEIAEEQLRTISYNNLIMIPALLKQPLSIQRRALRLWLFGHDLSQAAGFKRVNQLLAQCQNSDTSWKIQLSKDIFAKSDGNLLTIFNPVTREMLPEVEIVPDETILWGVYDIQIRRSKGIQATSEGVGVFPASCSLDAAKLKGKTLTVRQRQSGDRINPTGMAGSKKIKNILIDAKIPQEERDTIPIIACGDDVLWIPGYRISRDYALSDANADAIHITVTKSC